MNTAHTPPLSKDSTTFDATIPGGQPWAWR